MIPQVVRNWISENDFGAITSANPVGGGCINDGRILETESGLSYFLKTNRSAPQDMFTKEADGLKALQIEDGPVVPQTYLYGDDFILMENLSPASKQEDYWPMFGRQLATLHNHTHPHYGFADDNYIGSTPQPNPWMDDGFAFFGEQRLVYMTNLARQRNLMCATDAKQANKLISRLPELIPHQPPSLLHGDLWSGNAISDVHGLPAIIDPAVYYGWAEAELAMTALFGSFPRSFYNAYEEVRPLEPDYQTRFSIYNLYHLLNHLYIFGRSYLGQVQSILRRYS